MSYDSWLTEPPPMESAEDDEPDESDVDDDFYDQLGNWEE